MENAKIANMAMTKMSMDYVFQTAKTVLINAVHKETRMAFVKDVQTDFISRTTNAREIH